MTQHIIDLIRATTRPFLTYALTGAVVFCVVTRIPVPGELLTITGMAIAFWFADRKGRPDTNGAAEAAK